MSSFSAQSYIPFKNELAGDNGASLVGYKPGYAGAVNAGIGENFDHFTLKMFDAVPGAVVDNTAKIQAALNASSLSGIPVFVPKNDEFQFVGTVVMPDNAAIYGPGFLYYGGTGLAFNVNASGWHFGCGLRSHADKAITSITYGAVTEITVGAHGYSTGNEIMLGDILADNDLEPILELHYQKRQITVIDADRFAVPIDTSAVTKTFSSGWAMKYVNGHRGLFAQAGVPPAALSDWCADVSLAGARVYGFSDWGARIDYGVNVDVTDFTALRCGLYGLMLNSVIGYRCDGTLTVGDMGPGTGGTVYPFTTTRNYIGPPMTLAQSPRTQDGYISTLVVRNNPYYFAVDSHGGENLSFGQIIHNNCYGGFNYEHASGSGELVPARRIQIGSYVGEGNNPDYHTIGPLFNVDGYSGAGETQVAVSVKDAHSRNHGGGSAADINPVPVTSPGALIYARFCDGLMIDTLYCEESHRCILRADNMARGVVIGNLVSKGLAAVDGQADHITTTNGSAVVNIKSLVCFGGTYAVNAGGRNSGAGLFIDDVQVYDGCQVAAPGNYAFIAGGNYFMGGQLSISFDGTGASPIALNNFMRKRPAIDPPTVERISTGRYRVTWPSQLELALRNHVSISVDGGAARIVSRNDTECVFETYDPSTAYAAAEFADVSLMVFHT